ncbi:Helix-turn-helix domain protein [compost metagenome]
MGTSPGQILLNLRMKLACQLLQRGHAVAEVADACGYQSVASFTRAFDKLLGMPPGAYRRRSSP